jgi:hypothetical protein
MRRSGAAVGGAIRLSTATECVVDGWTATSIPGKRAPRIEREGEDLHLRVAGPEEHE